MIFLNFHVFHFRGGHMLRKKMKTSFHPFARWCFFFFCPACFEPKKMFSSNWMFYNHPLGVSNGHPRSWMTGWTASCELGHGGIPPFDSPWVPWVPHGIIWGRSFPSFRSFFFQIKGNKKIPIPNKKHSMRCIWLHLITHKLAGVNSICIGVCYYFLT